MAQLRDEREDVPLGVFEFVVSAPRSLGWSGDYVCSCCRSPVVVSIDIPDLYHDEMGDPAGLSGALHAVGSWLIEHEQGVAKLEMGPGNRSVIVPRDPMFLESEGAFEELTCPGEVLVTK